jgi:hypothetical protein
MVPLPADEVAALDDCDGGELLDGIAHDTAADRPAIVAVTSDNRLLFEREWLLPAHNLPPSRREMVEQASEPYRILWPARTT